MLPYFAAESSHAGKYTPAALPFSFGAAKPAIFVFWMNYITTTGVEIHEYTRGVDYFKENGERKFIPLLYISVSKGTPHHFLAVSFLQKSPLAFFYHFADFHFEMGKYISFS